jgi:hypothetical protein
MQLNKPIVFLMDFDNNMIGNIQPQIDEYLIFQNIKNKNKNKNKNNLRFNRKLLQQELKMYISRPYLNKFLTTLSKFYNIEFFIYTASEHNWASFVIPIFEKSINFKFNRPLFTRKHLTKDFYKSIELIKPYLFKSLKNKYKLKNIHDIKFISLIDNRNDILLENNYLIKSNDFYYIHQINYLRNIPDYQLPKIYTFIENILNLDKSDNLYDFYSKYYKTLKDKYKYASIINKTHINDKFFYKLLKKITKYLNKVDKLHPYSHTKMIKIANS